MTADALTRFWVRTYTRGLPGDAGAARIAEIESDLHEHRSSGAPGLAIVGRTLRGIPADVIWRREERRAMQAASGRLTGIQTLWATATQSWFAPFAVLTALFNLLMAVAVFVEEDGKMPGQVVGPIVVLALTAALLTGLRLRWRSGQPTRVASASAVPSSPPPRRRAALVALAFLAVVAVLLGMMSSLYLLAAGVITLAGVAATARRGRTPRRMAAERAAKSDHVVLADVLIIIGTLPALGMWWLIVPGILAVIVIGGVIGTGPGTRRRAAEAV